MNPVNLAGETAMNTVSVQEAKAKLAELIHQLNPGDEVIITENDQPVARLVPATAQTGRRLGTLKGSVTYMAPDFDAPLDEIKDCMQ